MEERGIPGTKEYIEKAYGTSNEDQILDGLEHNIKMSAKVLTNSEALIASLEASLASVGAEGDDSSI